MRTLGIDLAAGDKNTAGCVVTWCEGRATVERPCVGLSDAELLRLIAQADKVGIDAPFGWPDEFVDAVAAHRALGRWPGPERAGLSYRETDRVAAKQVPGCRPLSVAADKIAACAMRCAYLLDRLAEAGSAVDRAGTGRVIEVYPAGALRCWDLPSSRYKKASGAGVRRDLVARLRRKAPWLHLPAPIRAACEESDHVVDALVAALVARAAALGATHRPAPGPQTDRARREGWIHLPTSSLAELAEQRPVNGAAPSAKASA